MISFPVKDRGSLRAWLAPTAAQALELELLPDWLFPILDLADLSRKQLAANIWQTRLTPKAREALFGQIPPAPLFECPAAPVWRTVYWSVFVPPNALLTLQGSRTFKWRMYGGDLPFYQEGWSDAYGEARLDVGWGMSFVAVDCLVASGETIRESLQAPPRPLQPIL